MAVIASTKLAQTERAGHNGSANKYMRQLTFLEIGLFT